MSRARRTSNKRKHESENERPTRKSARLSNARNGTLQSTSFEIGKTTEKHQRHLGTSPVITRSRKRTRSHYLYCPKPEAIVISDDSSDSTDDNCVKALTYSSSDSNAKVLTRHSFHGRVLRKQKVNDVRISEKECVEISAKVKRRGASGQNRYKLRKDKSVETLNVDKERKIAKSKNSRKKQLGNGCASEEVRKSTFSCKYNLRKSPRLAATVNVTPDTSRLNEENEIVREEQKAVIKVRQILEEPAKIFTSSVVLSDVIHERCYHLRRRTSPANVENVSETSKISEKKAKNKTPKTKLNEPRYENIEKHSGTDVEKVKPRVLTQFTCASSSNPSFVNKGQERAVKKTKVKKKGTLARKKELRALLEKQDEGYEDDAFEGTPFRYRKRLSKCKVSPVVLDTSIRCINTDSDLKTPFSKTPVNRLRPAGPLSSGTSESDTMTPGLLKSVNRNYIDCYVNQLKRRKIHLGCNKVKSRTPLSKKPFRIMQSKSFDFLTNDIVKRSTMESENCEDDYYWSDAE
ncbi:uncharacterized protein LOC114516072 [Dendronephthya gigantea]|uniref:uncharacterized protein LOC114516072 n=1 Tax=Dendronephthya gigantea TaxID=151771 RepID=UPI00106C78D8|nr:uncharacterized protein LOC114516072 [Dendronephthya gigantea]